MRHTTERREFTDAIRAGKPCELVTHAGTVLATMMLESYTTNGPYLPEHFSVRIVNIDNTPVIWKGWDKCGGMAVKLPDRFINTPNGTLWIQLLIDFLTPEKLGLEVDNVERQAYIYKMEPNNSHPLILVEPDSIVQVIPAEKTMKKMFALRAEYHNQLHNS